jgi:hypothetical protein
MNDKALIRLLRLGEWGGAGDEEMVLAADRIEQLVKGVEISSKAMDYMILNAVDLEAKLAKAVEVLKMGIYAAAHEASPEAFGKAAVAVLAELEKTE